LRPLLKIGKKEILKYLEDRKLEYKVDESNFDIDITRNYLRHKIIPKFKKVNSKYKKNIADTLEYFEDLKRCIDHEIVKFL